VGPAVFGLSSTGDPPVASSHWEGVRDVRQGLVVLIDNLGCAGVGPHPEALLQWN
jgi:hypothetical protein